MCRPAVPSGSLVGGSIPRSDAPPAAPAALEPPIRARCRRLPIIGVLGVALVIALIAIAVAANIALSQTYSPSCAVLDYFAAQQQGDVNRMWANATYFRGEG